MSKREKWNVHEYSLISLCVAAVKQKKKRNEFERVERIFEFVSLYIKHSFSKRQSSVLSEIARSQNTFSRWNIQNWKIFEFRNISQNRIEKYFFLLPLWQLLFFIKWWIVKIIQNKQHVYANRVWMIIRKKVKFENIQIIALTRHAN